MQNLKAKYNQRTNPSFGNLSTVVQNSNFIDANELNLSAHKLRLFKKKVLQMAL
jgi:hypothetical protein